jgi:hypothetical protein
MSEKLQALLDGAARVFDLSGRVEYNSPRDQRSDADALRSDWEAVGNDLRRAAYAYREQRK